MPTPHAIFDLPLSWARTDASSPVLRALKLPLSRRNWIPCADVPSSWTFQQIFADHLQPLSGGFILHGCNERLARFVQARGGQAAHVGVEAAWLLESAVKPSLLELARRGRRWGEVKALTPNDINRAKMDALWEATKHSSKPQLQCAFRTEFDASVRGFALVGQEGDWLGALTLSLMMPGYWHTELLLRRQDAPVGVMEALIVNVRERLLSEGGRWLSLGTVPFVSINDPLASVPCRNPLSPACRGKVIARLGQMLRFGYDYRGLYQFKAKFEPEWRPLYLCGWPDLPWRILPDLSWATRHLHLVGYAALRRLGY